MMNEKALVESTKPWLNAVVTTTGVFTNKFGWGLLNTIGLNNQIRVLIGYSFEAHHEEPGIGQIIEDNFHCVDLLCGLGQIVNRSHNLGFS